MKRCLFSLPLIWNSAIGKLHSQRKWFFFSKALIKKESNRFFFTHQIRKRKKEDIQIARSIDAVIEYYEKSELTPKWSVVEVFIGV